MLKLDSLKMTNFAIFEFQEVTFTPGFNCIVGETGSGKSLIVEALELVFGQRADKKVIRKNSEQCILEAVFLCKDQDIKKFLNEMGFPVSNDELIIKRVIQKNGQTKNYLNFQSCTLNHITTVCRRYVDLVGQFENQKLLSENYQLALLDSFSEIRPELKKYQDKYFEYAEQKKLLEEKTSHFQKNKEREDFLKFQISELSELAPSVKDEEALSQKKKELSRLHSSKVAISRSLSLLEEGDSSLLHSLKILSKETQTFSTEKQQGNLRTAQSLLEDFHYDLQKKLDFEVSEDELNEIENRLDHYQKAKRKFSTDTEGLVKTLTSYQEELTNIQNHDSNVKMLEEELNLLKESCWNMAMSLHSKRAKSSKKLEKELTKAVRSLKMKNAEFQIRLIEQDSLNEAGISKVSFFAETNLGEGYFKIKDIASGGELSRILLSVRKILSVKDSISIFLFDEVDTGVGGPTAKAIGESLKQVSKECQVISITHLPQIAVEADHLIKVSKDLKTIKGEKRTISQIEIFAASKDIRDEAEKMAIID